MESSSSSSDEDGGGGGGGSSTSGEPERRRGDRTPGGGESANYWKRRDKKHRFLEALFGLAADEWETLKPSEHPRLSHISRLTDDDNSETSEYGDQSAGAGGMSSDGGRGSPSQGGSGQKRKRPRERGDSTADKDATTSVAGEQPKDDADNSSGVIEIESDSSADGGVDGGGVIRRVGGASRRIIESDEEDDDDKDKEADDDSTSSEDGEEEEEEDKDAAATEEEGTAGGPEQESDVIEIQSSTSESNPEEEADGSATTRAAGEPDNNESAGGAGGGEEDKPSDLDSDEDDSEDGSGSGSGDSSDSFGYTDSDIESDISFDDEDAADNESIASDGEYRMNASPPPPFKKITVNDPVFVAALKADYAEMIEKARVYMSREIVTDQLDRLGFTRNGEKWLRVARQRPPSDTDDDFDTTSSGLVRQPIALGKKRVYFQFGKDKRVRIYDDAHKKNREKKKDAADRKDECADAKPEVKYAPPPPPPPPPTVRGKYDLNEKFVNFSLSDMVAAAPESDLPDTSNSFEAYFDRLAFIVIAPID